MSSAELCGSNPAWLLTCLHQAAGSHPLSHPLSHPPSHLISLTRSLSHSLSLSLTHCLAHLLSTPRVPPLAYRSSRTAPRSPHFFADLKDDITDEAEKHGEVLKCTVLVSARR